MLDQRFPRPTAEGPHRSRPSIVCLCGSTRFMDTFFDAGWDFTLRGWIVLSVGVCKHTDAEGGHGAEAISDETAHELDILHYRKIDLCDLVFVLNVDGYIGESTRREILYAESIGRTVCYLEHEEDADELPKEQPEVATAS